LSPQLSGFAVAGLTDLKKLRASTNKVLGDVGSSMPSETCAFLQCLAYYHDNTDFTWPNGAPTVNRLVFSAVRPDETAVAEPVGRLWLDVSLFPLGFFFSC
jgi:hypothetical protein